MAKVFGTAGVRGVFNQTQTPKQVYDLVETISFVFGRGDYGVGWDGRKTSALLARTVMAAISAVGNRALSFGMVPTPVVAYGSRSRSCRTSFSVTASHNPPEFSGVKVFNGFGMELSRAEEDRVERALAVDVMRSSGTFGLASDDQEVVGDYIDDLVSRYEKASNGLRIAIDCANGPGGGVTPNILKRLGHSVLTMNAQVSWRFPARNPEPTSANLSDFARTLSGLGVDLGFAHDGDADRLVLVDGRGNVLPDFVLTALALHGLESSSGTVVISENSSSMVEEEAKRIGFDVVRSRVGKSFALLKEKGGVFASEPSKIVDPRWGYWEDGINAAALVSTLLSKDKGLLERMAQTRWHYKQVNLNVLVRMPRLMENSRESFKRFKVVEERTLDGYKIVFADDSWIMFRASGTEPKTRIYCESKDPEVLAALIQEGTRCVESSL